MSIWAIGCRTPRRWPTRASSVRWKSSAAPSAGAAWTEVFLRFLLGLLRLLAGLLIVATALPAILAIFGFAVPFFDLFNHLQLLLFFGTLVGAVLALLALS